MSLASLQKWRVSKFTDVVISISKKTAQYVSHLIHNIWTVLHFRLSVQIAYAEELELFFQYWAALISQSADIEMLNLLTVLNYSTLQLINSDFAVKLFVILVSIFEQIILLDTNAVFLQQSELIFENTDYISTDTSLIHDCLMY